MATIDKSEVRARLDIVAKTLDIPQTEIDDAMKRFNQSARPLADFCWRYGQSLDWVCTGDMRGLISTAAFERGWRPAWWTDEREEGHAAWLEHARQEVRAA